MKNITLVTGNPGKLLEWQRLFPNKLQLMSRDIDLDEIQSLDMDKIIADKAQRAFAALLTPIIVEDVSAGIDDLGNLPGPFIKFFEQKLGLDALYQMARCGGAAATILATVAYYDGSALIVGRGEVHGTVCKPRGTNGFGFDACFVPNGQQKSYGEMQAAEKDTFSHRAIAIKDLAQKLEAHFA